MVRLLLVLLLLTGCGGSEPSAVETTSGPGLIAVAASPTLTGRWSLIFSHNGRAECIGSMNVEARGDGYFVGNFVCYFGWGTYYALAGGSELTIDRDGVVAGALNDSTLAAPRVIPYTLTGQLTREHLDGLVTYDDPTTPGGRLHLDVDAERSP